MIIKRIQLILTNDDWLTLIEFMCKTQDYYKERNDMEKDKNIKRIYSLITNGTKTLNYERYLLRWTDQTGKLHEEMFATDIDAKNEKNFLERKYGVDVEMSTY